MNASPSPPLLRSHVPDAAMHQAGLSEYHIPALKQVAEGGGWGGDAKNATAVRGPDPFDSDTAYAPPVESPIDQGYDVDGLDAGELEHTIMDEFKASLVHCRPRGNSHPVCR